MPIKNGLVFAIAAGLQPADGAAPCAVAIWHALTRKLAPLMGPASTRLLLARALEAQRAAYPWLPSPDLAGVADPPFDALQASLASQAPQDAVAATQAMLDTYIDLVTTLIGARLAEQFLRAACPPIQPERNTEEKRDDR